MYYCTMYYTPSFVVALLPNLPIFCPWQSIPTASHLNFLEVASQSLQVASRRNLLKPQGRWVTSLTSQTGDLTLKDWFLKEHGDLT